MTTRFVQAASLLTRDLQHAVLVRTRGGEQVHSLTGAGTEIWRLLASPVTFDELLAALAERFDVEPAQIDEDVSRILDELVRARLVDRRAA